MADSLSSIGSIANFIATSFSWIPAGVSGNLIIITDCARQYVSSFTGQNIGSNSIPEPYQAPIVDFAMADTLDLLTAQAGGEDIRLGDLSISEKSDILSSEQYRQLGEMKLKSIGRRVTFARSLS